MVEVISNGNIYSDLSVEMKSTQITAIKNKILYWWNGKLPNNWNLYVFQISCSWIRKSGIHFGTEGVRERWGRDEWNGKLTQRCKSGTGYDCSFLKVLKTRKMLTLSIKKCLIIPLENWVSSVLAFKQILLCLISSNRFNFWPGIHWAETLLNPF